MNVEQARFNMIEQQIRPWEVLDESVLSLLSIVRREEFCLPEHQALAFMDLEIPLPGGRCMLAPKVEARIVQALNPGKRDTVLHIGAATGYVTALLAHKARRVIAMESVAELADVARANLRRAAINNAEVLHNDGRSGLPEQGPFDSIVITGSVATVPQVLFDQVKEGGQLLAIVGTEPVMVATLYTRGDNGRFTSQALFDTVAKALDGFQPPSRFQF